MYASNWITSNDCLFGRTESTKSGIEGTWLFWSRKLQHQCIDFAKIGIKEHYSFLLRAATFYLHLSSFSLILNTLSIFNADFTPSLGNTPSCGNTPMHRGSLAGALLSNRSSFAERPPVSLPQSSPRHKRKNLLELFKESSRNRNLNEQDAEDNQNGPAAGLQLPPKSTSSTPHLPVSSGKSTPVGKFRSEAKSLRSVQCCLPRLSGSFREKRKSMSPANSVG